MNDMTPYGLPRLIPLSDLTLSPLNHRQTVAEAEIAAMADSIALCGLLQNLIGLERDGRVEIVGGGKRLRALHLLAAEGWRRKVGQLPIDPVPVLVTDDEHRAVAWSGAENTARSELGPADEIESYAALHARGTSVSMIAATFAVTESHVARRLKLADLPEPVIANLRAGKINIDQARALTIAPDEKTCIAVLAQVLRDDLHHSQIRRALTPDTISLTDRRARYVGVDAYRAAGGRMTEDLFQEGAYLHDADLLNRLFLDKGRAEAEALRIARGWAWSEFLMDVTDHVGNDYRMLTRASATLPEGDMDELEELQELGETGLTEAGLARLEELEARLEGDFSAEDYAVGGIVCRVNFKGAFLVDGEYVRIADLPVAGNDDSAGDSAGDKDADGPSNQPPKPESIPQNLRDDLTTIRLRAIQTRLFDKPELMLDLLAFSLTFPVWNRPVSVSVDAQKAAPERTDGLNDDARFDRSDTRRVDDLRSAFEAFRAEGKAHRNKALTHALARAFRTTEGPLIDLLDLSPDPRAIWTPTAAGYFGRLPGATLDAIWAELVPVSDIDPNGLVFAGFKKAEKAKKLEKLFLDMDVREAMGLSRAQNAAIDAWLPPELRFKTVDG